MTRIGLRQAADDDLTVALRALDAASQADPDRAQSPRARADLERVLRTEPAQMRIATSASQTSPWRRRAWLLAVAGALGAVAVLSSVLGDDPPAGAAWSAVPSAPTTQERATAGDQCVDFLGTDRPAGQEPTEATPAELEAMTVVLAERRGPWTFTLLAGPGGLTADCLLHDDPDTLVTERPEGTSVATNGGGIRQVEPTELAPEQIEPFSWGASYVDIGGYSTLTGRVGVDVTAITIDTPDDRRVTATVENGYWAAWWPVDSQTPRAAYPTVTATLADGTTTEPIPFDELFQP